MKSEEKETRKISVGGNGYWRKEKRGGTHAVHPSSKKRLTQRNIRNSKFRRGMRRREEGDPRKTHLG